MASSSIPNRPTIPADPLGLHILSEPENPDVIIQADIVAVHGLGGDSYGTWTHKNGKLWLRDLLPSDLGNNVRIMTFGYDARVIKGFIPGAANKNRVDTFAERLLEDVKNERSGSAKTRPLFFISHSLGGIVVKEALLIAHSRQSHYRDLLSSVWHLMFFGTPHQGTGATVSNFLIDLGATLGISKSSSAIQELSLWSSTLVRATKLFGEIADNFSIASYWETQKTHGIEIVHEGSATLGQKREVSIGLNADHHQLCKFESAHSANYRSVRSKLRAEIEKLKEAGAETEHEEIMVALLKRELVVPSNEPIP